MQVGRDKRFCLDNLAWRDCKTLKIGINHLHAYKIHLFIPRYGLIGSDQKVSFLLNMRRVTLSLKKYDLVFIVIYEDYDYIIQSRIYFDRIRYYLVTKIQMLKILRIQMRRKVNIDRQMKAK